MNQKDYRRLINRILLTCGSEITDAQSSNPRIVQDTMKVDIRTLQLAQAGHRRAKMKAYRRHLRRWKDRQISEAAEAMVKVPW